MLSILMESSDITPEISNVILKFFEKKKIDLFAFISNKKNFSIV